MKKIIILVLLIQNCTAEAAAQPAETWAGALSRKAKELSVVAGIKAAPDLNAWIESKVYKSAGAEPDSTDADIEKVRIAIELGYFPVNYRIRKEPLMPLLHIAAQKNDLNLAKMLVQKGAKIEEKDGFNRTPLQVAQTYSSERYLNPVVEYLSGLLAKRQKEIKEAVSEHLAPQGIAEIVQGYMGES